jgi:hypothetical protein
VNVDELKGVHWLGTTLNRLAPIEANPIEAKGKKWVNIPIQANPRNSVVTSETRIQIRINRAVAATKLYILNL